MSISFLKAEPVVSSVNGNDLNFYPLSLRVAFELRALSGPISSALSVMFSDSDNDRGWSKRTFSQEDGTVGETTEAEPSPKETIEFRLNSKREAIATAFETLTDAKNGMIIGKIIADSLREEFERNLDTNTIQDFINSEDLDILSLKQLIVGVAKANQRVFGETGKKVVRTLEEEVSKASTTPSGTTSTSPQSSPSLSALPSLT
jgi:hypothetical protein